MNSVVDATALPFIIEDYLLIERHLRLSLSICTICDL